MSSRETQNKAASCDATAAGKKKSEPEKRKIVIDWDELRAEDAMQSMTAQIARAATSHGTTAGHSGKAAGADPCMLP